MSGSAVATRSFRILVNSASSGGRAPGLVLPVARLLRDAGATAEVLYSPGRHECAQLVEEAVSSGQVVVAAGGDGMISSLAGTVMRAGGVLGLLPAGRGNDFARHLGLSNKPEEVAETLLHREPRAVDVMEVAGRIVVGSVYAGVDSLASDLVNRSHRLPRQAQYPYAAIRALVSFQPAVYDLVIDGERQQHEAATVVIANSGYYGSGMHIAPRASVTDGLLDVVVLEAAPKLQLLRAMPKVYKGTHVDRDEVHVLRGKEVSLSAQTPMIAYADGDPLDELPLHVSVRPSAVRMLT